MKRTGLLHFARNTSVRESGSDRIASVSSLRETSTGKSDTSMAKQRKQLKVPKFRNEDAERAFWAKVNLSEHFGSEDFDTVAFPGLKPSSRANAIRLSERLLMRLKEQANALDVPYQSLIKRDIANGMRDPRA